MNFKQEVLEADQPVLVDFWAEWCGPCQMMGPIIEELGEEMADQIKVIKVNVEENKQLAGQYNIRSIPNLILFSEGEVVKRWLGVQNKGTLKEEIVDVLEE